MTLTPSLPSPQDIGTTVNFLAEATGGTGNYQYEFRTGATAPGTLVQAYSTNPTYRWYTDGLPAGTTTFRVNARVVGTTGVVTTTAAFTIATATAKTVTLTSSLPSPQPSGTSVTFNALASGGSGTYEYQFSDNVSGAMIVVQPFSASAAFLLPTTTPAGTYQFQVAARTAGSGGPAEATSAPLPFTIQAGMGATLIAFPTSPQTSRNIRGIPRGPGAVGRVSYEYQFSDNVTGTMAVRQAYSQNSTRVWNTTGVPFGTYGLKVDIRNVGSTAASQATTTIAYTLAPLPATGVVFTPAPFPQARSLRGPSDRDRSRQRWVGALRVPVLLIP